MARLPSIPRAKLNTAIKQLPKPVGSHLKRCRQLAEYVMERIEAEDWFVESKIKAEHIVNAIGYHDIGKCFLKKEEMFLEHCTTAASRNTYKSHIGEGIAFVERECEVRLEEYRPTSFGGILYQVLDGHHRYLDGSGFPEAVEENGTELSFAAKLCMVIDTFDNLLFVGHVGELDVNKAIEELNALSGKKLDASVVELLLSDIPTLRNFVLHMNKKERTARRGDSEEYGLVLQYDPYYNISKHRVSGYRVRLALYDTYYGLMKSEAFMQIAERTGQVTKIEKAAFEKLCIYLEQLFELTDRKPRFIFEVSATNFEKKNFARDYLSILKQYDIPERSIYFAFREDELLHLSEDIPWKDVMEELRREGIGLMIDGFGESTSIVAALGDLQIDMLGLKKDYTQQMTNNKRAEAVVAGLARMAGGLHVNMLASGVTNTRQEAEYSHMRVKYAMGELYSAPMTFRELKKAYNDGPLTIGG